MKLCALFLLLLVGSNSALEGNVTIASRRYLMESHNDFKLLECNQPACNKGRTTWMDEGYNVREKIVIPCGLCVTMNHPGPRLELPHGMDIQGSLIFPDNYKIDISTPFIIVQGDLRMTSTRAVTWTPDVRFFMTGRDETMSSFVPAGNNRYACSSRSSGTPEPCQLGAKAIVVAGGRLDISALPDRCRTWVLLEDLVSSNDNVVIPRDYTNSLPDLDPNHPNSSCRSSVHLNSTFVLNGDGEGWTGGYGARTRVNSGYLRVFGRRSDKEHGPTFDLLDVRGCFIPNQDYLISFRVRLNSSSRSGLTTCSKSGVNCLQMMSYARLTDGQVTREKVREVAGDRFEYGRWEHMYATIQFTREELDSTAVYHLLRLQGPEPDVTIDIDDFVLTLPSPELVPDRSNVCRGNLIRNGNAEASEIHPFPLTTFGKGKLSVQTTRNGNSFFRLEGRTRSSDSLAYEIPTPSCLVAGSHFRVSARVRIRSNMDVETSIVYRAFSHAGVLRFVMAKCPPSRRQFVQCRSEFMVPPDYKSEDIDRLVFSFETDGSSRSTLEVDNWEVELISGSKNSLLVRAGGVDGCWGEGAEVLVTSHTTDMNSAQQFRLLSAPFWTEDGYVRLEVDKAVVPPVTVKDGDGFAVEVALLSRNILWQGVEDEVDPLLGGHLIVFHTPQVVQKLQGVEMRNFGRQGQLGRYPIHFHLCNNVEGSRVSKNTIRDSKQRCVVVHGSHNLTVSENVAYVTMGHCFMTEDGGEFDNVFERNLGASTRSARRLVRSFESDRTNPTTFWASNPWNSWIENVAAGSESMGYWFELQDAVRSPTSLMPLSRGVVPRRTQLKLFINNVAHSNGRTGLRTYPFGFLPQQEATFHNIRSYKNRQDGVFLHNTRNVRLLGGAIADNGVSQADLDRADDIAIEGTRVIGRTVRYKEIVSTQAESPPLPESIVGLELHSFATDASRSGATILDVEFSGFGWDLEADASLIQVDDDKWTGSFDYWTSIRGTRLMDGPSPRNFNFAKAASAGISNIYLTDIDSRMQPTSLSVSGTSTVMSDSSEMKAFIDLSRCLRFETQAYLYCSDTCLRTVTIAVNPEETEDYHLQIVNARNTSQSFLFPGRYHYESGPGEKSDMRKRRIFTPTLPSGQFLAEFRSTRSGHVSWPTFAEVSYEEKQCSSGIEAGNLVFSAPRPSESECHELISNGDMEMSSAATRHWLQRDNIMTVVVGKGLGGSIAIADSTQASSRASVGQFLDTRCIVRGRQFDIRAWIRLERNGSTYLCGGSNCPRIGLRVKKSVDIEGSSFNEFYVPVTSSFVHPVKSNGFNLMQASFAVDERFVGASSVAFSIDRGLTNVRMILDDISMTRIDSDCRDLVFNGDFSEAHSVFWGKEGSQGSQLSLISISGRRALMLSKRSSSSDAIVQQIRVGCITQSSRYVVSARFKLQLSDGVVFHCNPNSSERSTMCPRIRLKSYSNSDVHVHSGGSIAESDHGVTTDGWHTINGIFSATTADETAEKLLLSFIDAPKGKSLIVADVSIVPSKMSCMQLLANGDAEEGETAMFWRSIGSGQKTSIEILRQGGSNIFKISGRGSAADGMRQLIDVQCFKKHRQWKLTAMMKLVSKSSGRAVVCDPFITRGLSSCPPVVFIGSDEHGNKVEATYRMTNRPEWTRSSFNPYEVIFSIPTSLSSANVLSFSIRSYNIDWELFVDNLSLSPV